MSSIGTIGSGKSEVIMGVHELGREQKRQKELKKLAERRIREKAKKWANGYKYSYKDNSSLDKNIEKMFRQAMSRR